MPGSGLRWLSVLFAGSLAGLLAIAAPSALAQSARLTILDGDATLIDGARRLAATEGQPLAERTIVETGPSLKLLRVEWPDGTVADFGPDTRAMLAPGALLPGDKRGPAFYLLRGWAKQGSHGDAATAGQLSPRLQLAAFKGVAVTFVAPAESFVFMESGEAGLVERNAKPPRRLALKAGEVYSLLDAGSGGTTAPRATPEQLKRVPRGFRETLPLQAARFAGKDIAPRPLPAPTYAELQPWLTAEVVLRKPFPVRFANLAREPQFRKELVDHLAAHPEWRQTLFPDPPRNATGTVPAAPAASR